MSDQREEVRPNKEFYYTCRRCQQNSKCINYSKYNKTCAGYRERNYPVGAVAELLNSYKTESQG